MSVREEPLKPEPKTDDMQPRRGVRMAITISNNKIECLDDEHFTCLINGHLSKYPFFETVNLVKDICSRFPSEMIGR